jgi:hypothetical protein
MANGADAVAALSMDGVRVGQNSSISVKLRSENWTEDFMQQLGSMLETETTVDEQALSSLAAMNLNLDGMSFLN